jgi:hypothetical protein
MATSTNGIFIPAPAGMNIWQYYHYMPFVDRGTNQPSGYLYVNLKLEVLASVSYTSFGVQFSNDGTNWSSTVVIDSSSGSYSAGDTINTNVTLRAGYTNPEFFRIVIGSTVDNRTFTIAHDINI